MIINSQFYSTHFGVVVLRAYSALRLRFAHRRLCTFNSFGVNIISSYHQITTSTHHQINTLSHHHIITSSHHHNNFVLCSYESEVETMIINSQYYSTHFGVVVLRAS